MESDDIRVRRVAAGDGPALERFYAELSPESLRLRFHAATRGISVAEAEDLARVDHQHREGFVAVADGRIVGHLVLEPDGPAREEMAIAVRERHQHHGVGTLLITAGLASARLRGIGRIVAWVLPDNLHMRHLITALPHPVRTTWIGSVACCEIDLNQTLERAIA
jgi:GNAT superfamily N-acetyltransferase